MKPADLSNSADRRARKNLLDLKASAASRRNTRAVGSAWRTRHRKPATAARRSKDASDGRTVVRTKKLRYDPKRSSVELQVGDDGAQYVMLCHVVVSPSYIVALYGHWRS